MSTPTRILSRPRFAWLLWLALLLPLAQAAATWHTYSHTSVERTAPVSGKQGLAADLCDLCLTAAGITGGAAPSTPLAIAHHEFQQAAPVFDSGLPSTSTPWLTYRSRAPPFSSH